MKTLVLVGATSIIASECTRLWLKKGYDRLVLMGWNEDKLSEAASLLKKYCSDKTLIESYAFDFHNTTNVRSKIAQAVKGGIPDTVLIAQGTLVAKKDQNADDENLKGNFFVNQEAPILFLESFLTAMLPTNNGNIGIIGSVASSRNHDFVYGAMPGFLEDYVHHVQERLEQVNSKVQVSLIKPSPLNTPVVVPSAESKSFKRSKKIAFSIVKGMDKDRSVIYSSGIMRFMIFSVIRFPYFVVNRIFG